MKLNNKYEILTPNGFEDFLGVRKIKNKTIEIFFNNGANLRGSFNHIIYDYDNKEICLKDIKKGDKIKSHDGFLIVEKIKKHYNKTNLYDIVNSGIEHTYYSNDIISHNCDFLGSGDAVISTDIQDNISKNMLQEPKERYMNSTLWQWKEPINGHRYIMGCDVSRGDSDDFSSINIIDFDDREQVMEYIGKIPPDELAFLANKWGLLYNAFIVIDITGGMGVATSRKLQELNYKNLFYDGINTQNIWEYNKKILEKVPGLNFNNKRTQIVSIFEEQLRKGFIIRSSRLLGEIGKFVYINGRPDHVKGAHDDSIMSISMALYAGEISFSQLEKNNNQNKAIIESWMMNERSFEPNKTHYSHGTSFDQISLMGIDNNSIIYDNNPISDTKKQYMEYSWLFGKNKKLK